MQNLKLFRPYLLDNCLNDVGPLKGNRTLFLRKVSLIFKANSEILSECLRSDENGVEYGFSLKPSVIRSSSRIFYYSSFNLK